MRLKNSFQTYSRYSKKLKPWMKKPKVKAYTMIILSLFTMSFFGFFAIKPTLATITHLKRKIKDSRTVDQNLETKIIHLSQLKEEHQNLENELSLVPKALPSEPQYSQILEELENLANQAEATISGVKLEKVRPSQEDSQSANKLSCSLTLEANYQSAKDFLNYLLNSPRLYTIEKFAIASETKENRQLIKLQLKIDTYYLKI